MKIRMGLIRQYLQKGCDFNKVTDSELNLIVENLNNKRRKILKYVTRGDIFNNN